ncbi:hypothetical protein ANO11243_069550 [Dothideomycetidae sp. 11243]|nr:hypothetical protein ANO11243_069550 [fungal sp. No.11243]
MSDGHKHKRLRANGPEIPHAMPVRSAAEVPGVRYKDLTAEVDARLAAKRVRLAAAKTSKKRKRESLWSVSERAAELGVDGEEVLADEEGRGTGKRRKKIEREFDLGEEEGRSGAEEEANGHGRERPNYNGRTVSNGDGGSSKLNGHSPMSSATTSGGGSKKRRKHSNHEDEDEDFDDEFIKPDGKTAKKRKVAR